MPVSHYFKDFFVAGSMPCPGRCVDHCAPPDCGPKCCAYLARKGHLSKEQVANLSQAVLQLAARRARDLEAKKMHRFDEERPPVVDSRDYRDVAQSVFTLTLPHRADRRALLNASAARYLPARLQPTYVFGQRCERVPANESCVADAVVESWLRMFNASIARNAFPALLTEDDVDFRGRSELPPLPTHWDIASLASIHHNRAVCQDLLRPTFVRPDSPAYHSAGALLFSSRGAIERLLRAWRERPHKYDKFRHFDMLFASHHPGVHIVCPPVLHWVTSFSNVLNKTRAAPVSTWVPPARVGPTVVPGTLCILQADDGASVWARPRTHLLERSRAVCAADSNCRYLRGNNSALEALPPYWRKVLAALQVLEETSCAGLAWLDSDAALVTTSPSRDFLALLNPPDDVQEVDDRYLWPAGVRPPHSISPRGAHFVAAGENDRYHHELSPFNAGAWVVANTAMGQAIMRAWRDAWVNHAAAHWRRGEQGWECVEVAAAGNKGTGSAARGHRSGEDIDLARIQRWQALHLQGAPCPSGVRCPGAPCKAHVHCPSGWCDGDGRCQKCTKWGDDPTESVDGSTPPACKGLSTNQTEASGKCRFSREYYEQGAFVEHVLRSESLRYAVRLVPWQLLQSREPPPLVQHFLGPEHHKQSQLRRTLRYSSLPPLSLADYKETREKEQLVRIRPVSARRRNSFHILHAECAEQGPMARAHGACCPAACGRCGGNGCDLRPGGRPQCCVRELVTANRSCDDHAPPCLRHNESKIRG